MPYSGSFTIQAGMTTTVPIALEMTMVTVTWSVTPTVIQDKYEIVVTQTFETNVPAPVLVIEPPNITLPNLQPGQVFNGEFKVTNYGLIEVYDVVLDFPRSIDDYDIEVMTSAIPNKIGAMKSITVPYRVTRRITTASLDSSLFDEVKGYGGGNCVKNFQITVRGKCIICPNSAYARVVEKIANYLISIFQDCPTTVTPSSPSTYTGGGGSVYVIPSTTGQGGGGGLPGSSSTPIQTSNPCNCKDEGATIEECKECRNSQPTNKAEGTTCKDDGNPLTIDMCKDGICMHIPTSCDITVGYTETQNRYDDIIKCAAIANSVNLLTIKEIIKAENGAFSNTPPPIKDDSTGLMQVTPDTARDVGMNGTTQDIINALKNPCTNIDIGTKVLAKRMGDVEAALDGTGIAFDDEDLRVYYEAAYNIGKGTFQYAVDIAVTNGIKIEDGWEDFTKPQDKLGGISIMRKAVGANLQTAAKQSTPYTIKADDRKKKYDKNGNGKLEEDEWYDWRTEEVLVNDRMKKVAKKFRSRGANICPEGSFKCDEANKNEQCNK